MALRSPSSEPLRARSGVQSMNVWSLRVTARVDSTALISATTSSAARLIRPLRRMLLLMRLERGVMSGLHAASISAGRWCFKMAVDTAWAIIFAPPNDTAWDANCRNRTSSSREASSMHASRVGLVFFSSSLPVQEGLSTPLVSPSIIPRAYRSPGFKNAGQWRNNSSNERARK